MTKKVGGAGCGYVRFVRRPAPSLAKSGGNATMMDPSLRLVCPDQFLWGEQDQGEGEGASSRLNPGQDRDSLGGSTEHTRPHACFSFSETGHDGEPSLFHNRAVFGPATGTVRGTWYTVAAVRSGGVGI